MTKSLGNYPHIKSLKKTFALQTKWENVDKTFQRKLLLKGKPIDYSINAGWMT